MKSVAIHLIALDKLPSPQIQVASATRLAGPFRRHQHALHLVGLPLLCRRNQAETV